MILKTQSGKILWARMEWLLAQRSRISESIINRNAMLKAEIHRATDPSKINAFKDIRQELKATPM